MKTDCRALSHQRQAKEREKVTRGHTRACISEGATTSKERWFVTTENDRPSNFSPTVFFFSRLCLKVAVFCPSCTRRTCGMANVARCPPPPSPQARSDEHNVRRSTSTTCAGRRLSTVRRYTCLVKGFFSFASMLCVHSMRSFPRPILSAQAASVPWRVCLTYRCACLLWYERPKLHEREGTCSGCVGPEQIGSSRGAGARAEGRADLPLGVSAERASGRNATSSSMLSRASARSSSSGRAGGAMAPRRKGGEN